MYVTIDVASGGLSLVEADDFTAFHVVAVPRDAPEADVGVALGSDGQATLGNTVMKHRAQKVRALHGGKILAGFQGLLEHHSMSAETTDD